MLEEALEEAVTCLRSENYFDDADVLNGLLSAIRAGDAAVFYKCKTHPTSLECERENFEGFRQFLRNEEAAGRPSLGDASAAARYLALDGHHQDCHS